MCGRYVSPDQAAIERAWHIGRDDGNPFARRFNVQPTTIVPLLRRDRASDAVELASARWGLIPHWWKDEKPPKMTFNTRSEEAATKPMWRQPLRESRCLVPAEGWYEWQEVERVDPATGEVKKIKQPHFIRLPGGKLFCFAGLMSLWTPPGKDAPLLSCSILTREAAPSLAEVHVRMPVALPDDAHAEWLDPSLKDGSKALELARARALSKFEHFPVSLRVNYARNDDPGLIEAVAASR
jgi:putative SOS response-associated peptidase YedK